MSTALYRRYRPSTFADVIGQEHVTEPLMQALRTGRVGHAYLFSGPRGCGKTTSARILARCLNCEEGPTATPCGVCPSCVALATGGPGSVDVIEIDAASHGGVDDARDLREKAAYGPAQSRFKVYIIDEAHMVTPQGFNALLKIVEEPPEHVKFVFATTEPEKVIGTIRSRTHHYPFRLVPPSRLTDYLEELCRLEGVAVEAGVLSFVVRAGGGSVRDSLSVLDQLIAGSGEEGLTYAGAAALLGFTEAELLDAVVEALAAGDGGAVFRQLDKVIETGHDPRRFIEDLLERFRDLIIVAASDDGAAAVLRGMPEDQLQRMRQQAASFGPGELSRCADLVNAGLTELSGATSPRLQLELICARLLLPGASGPSGHAARLDRLERRLAMTGAPGSGELEGRAGAGSWSSAAAQPRVGQPGARQPGAERDVGQSDIEGGAGFQPTGPGGREALRRAHAAARGDATPSQHDTPAGPTQGAAADRSRPAQAAGARPAQQPHDQGQRRQQGQAAETQHDQQGRPGQRAPGQEVSGQLVSGQAASGQRRQGRQGSGEPGPAPAEGARAGEGPVESAAEGSARPAPRGVLDTDAMRRSWPDVLARIFGIRRVTWTFLSEHAQVLEYDGTRLVLGIATEGLMRTFHNGPHAEVVRQALVESLGVDVRIEAVTMPPRGEGGDASHGGGGGRGGGAPHAPRDPRGRSGPARGGGPGDGTPGAEPAGPEHGGEPANQGGWPADDDAPPWSPDDEDGPDEDDVSPPVGTIEAPTSAWDDDAVVDEATKRPIDASLGAARPVGPSAESAGRGRPDPGARGASQDGGDAAPSDRAWGAALGGAERDDDPDDEDDAWKPVEGPRGDPLDVFAGVEGPSERPDDVPSEAAEDARVDVPDESPQEAPARQRLAGGKARLSAFERAKQALAAQSDGPAMRNPSLRAGVGDSRRGTATEADDPGVSEDDEVITDLGAIGTPVIAKVLGGVVIDEHIE